MLILPALICNGETCLNAPKKTIDRLENLQNILTRCLFAVPNSAPIPALNRNTGLLSVEHVINQKKLIFMHYITTLYETSLVNQIYAIQKELKFPGFIPEMKKLLHFYGLPDVLEKPFETKKKR